MKFGLEVHLEVDVLANQAFALQVDVVWPEEEIQIGTFFFIK